MTDGKNLITFFFAESIKVHHFRDIYRSESCKDNSNGMARNNIYFRSSKSQVEFCSTKQLFDQDMAIFKILIKSLSLTLKWKQKGGWLEVKFCK